MQRGPADPGDTKEQEAVASGAKLSALIVTEQPMVAAKQGESLSDTIVQQSHDAGRLNPGEEAGPDHSPASADAPIVVAALLKTPKSQHAASPLEAAPALGDGITLPIELTGDDTPTIHSNALEYEENPAYLSDGGSQPTSPEGSGDGMVVAATNLGGDEPPRQTDAGLPTVTAPIVGAESEVLSLHDTELSSLKESLTESTMRPDQAALTENNDADVPVGNLNSSYQREEVVSSIVLGSQPPLMECTTRVRSRDYTGPEAAWCMEKDLQPPSADTMHVVLSAHEIDIHGLHNTHPLKNMMPEMGVDDQSGIMFYQHCQTKDAEPQTFCVVGKKSFEVSPRIEVISSEGSDSAYAQPPVGVTKIVLSVPKFGTDSTVQEQKLGFYGEKFRVNDLQLLASSRADSSTLLSLVFSDKMSSAGGKRASGSEKTFNLYLDLQKRLLDNFSRDYDGIFHLGAISDAREMLIFFHSPFGVHFLQDVHRHRQQFEQVIGIMPAEDPRKQFLIDSINAIDSHFDPGYMIRAEREVCCPEGFFVEVKGQGTSEAILRTLYILTSPHYGLKDDFMDRYVDTCAEFLTNRNLRLLLTITIMESMVSAIRSAQLQIMGSTKEATPLTPLEISNILSRCPIQQIHKAMPGLAESVAGVLRATLGIPADGLDAATMTQLCVIHGFQDTVDAEIPDLDVGGPIVHNESALMDTTLLFPAVRNNVVAEAKLVAKNHEQAARKEDFYQQVSKKYKGVTADALRPLQLFEEMKNYLRQLDVSECKELVANAVAYDINSLLQGPTLPENAGEIEVITHLRSVFVHKQKCDIDQFGDSLSKCSARKIIELLEEQKEAITEGFFPSITGDRVLMRLTHSSDIPVSVCLPSKRSVQETSDNGATPSSYVGTVEASGISNIAGQQQTYSSIQRQTTQ
ncbi:MAG: hypothetical protein ACTJLK_04015 [Anaplasma sp.]